MWFLNGLGSLFARKPAPVPVPAPPPADPLDAINAQRWMRGLNPVKPADDCLSASAENNREMRAAHALGHLFVPSGDWQCAALGESDPAAIVRVWMNHYPHRRIILEPSLRFGGFAIDPAAPSYATFTARP